MGSALGSRGGTRPPTLRLLCLDTSTAAVTVAVVEDGTTLASVDTRAATRHGELLAPAVQDVLRRAPGPVDAVAVGLGPGPFTSLRVGIATAAALADALGVPAYGVCSLDLLAAPRRVVVQDARRREVYWATYDEQGARAQGPQVETPAALAERLAGLAPVEVVGAGAAQYADVLGVPPPGESLLLPTASRLWTLTADRAASGAPSEVLSPLYLRRPDARPPRPREPASPSR